MSKFALPRRTFLRGALAGAAATVALPPLEAMFNASGTALANGSPVPTRFGVFFWGNGILADRWVPSSTGANFQLTPELQPLANVRDYFSVVTGHDVKNRNLRGHHAGAAGILSGADIIPQDAAGAPYASTFGGPSVDVLVRNQIGNDTRFRSLEVGVDERVTRGEGTTLRYLSHNGPDNPNPQEYDPAVIFQRLFGEGFVAPGETIDVDPRLGVRRSILDAVREDARRLEARLGHADRIRLEQHLEGIETLQNQIQHLVDSTPPTAPTCERPEEPSQVPTTTTAGQRQRSRIMSDLLAMAMACDVTRVWTNLFSGSVSGTYFWDIDNSTTFHTLTHDEPGDQPKVHQSVVFIMQEFAYLLEKLRDTPEGDGNLLDHSVILGTSDLSSGKYHTLNEYPIIIAGRGSGRLRSGLHYRSTRDNAAKAVLTCIRGTGIPAESFGRDGTQTTDSIGALEV